MDSFKTEKKQLEMLGERRKTYDGPTARAGVLGMIELPTPGQAHQAPGIIRKLDHGRATR